LVTLYTYRPFHHLHVLRILVCATLMGIFSSANAQNDAGANVAAMAGTGLSNHNVWSGFHNQAGLAHLESFSAGVFVENRFAMKELGDKGITIGLPVRNGAFGINYRSFGYSAFSNSKAGLAYAMKLTDKFSLGVQLNYHAIRIGENYGTAQTFSIEGGFLYQMSEQLSVAAHIYNPTRAKLTEFNDERIPSLFRFGLGYKFSDKVRMNAEVRKASDAKANLRVGLEYWVIEPLAIRAGFGTDPARYTFGFGYRLKDFQLDVAAGYHLLLGFTPQLSLTYSMNKK
jgi:hypothetical protein